MSERLEILKDVNAVKRKDIQATEFTLNGISIGDLESVLKVDSIETGWNVNNTTKWVKNKTGGRYRVTDGKILEIAIDDALVKHLNINSIKDISTAFGETKTIDISGGWHYYFYESRDMVVYWNEKDKYLYGIFIGDTKKYPTFKRMDILTLYFDLIALEPNYKGWSESNLEWNESRFYRFKQLKSLLKAFGISEDYITSLSEGNFIRERPLTDYKELLADIEAFRVSKNIEIDKYFARGGIRYNDLQYMFNYIFKYRIELEKVLRYNSGWLETASDKVTYVIDRTVSFIR